MDGYKGTEIYAVLILNVESGEEVLAAISSEAYTTYSKAVEFIQGRTGNPQYYSNVNGWYMPAQSYSPPIIYKIKPLNVK